MPEEIEYRGFRLQVTEHGRGWRARILTPANTPMMEIPETDHPKGRNQIIREARAIVDRRIAILPTRALVPVPLMPRPGRRWRMFGR